MLGIVERDREDLARAGDRGVEAGGVERLGRGLEVGGRRPGGEVVPGRVDGLGVGAEAAVARALDVDHRAVGSGDHESALKVPEKHPGR